MKKFLLSVMLLAGCTKNEKVNLPENTNNVVEGSNGIDETNTENKPIEEETVVVDFDNLVEDAYSQIEGEKGAEVRLPHINIESEDVSKINSEINSKIQSTDFWVNPENYFYSRNGDILSVVAESIYDNIYVDTADVYNINLKSGKVLSNAELLVNASVNESDYDMKEIYKDEFKKKNESLLENKNETAIRFYNSLDDKEIKLSDEKLYLDSDNALHVLLQFPYMAGPDDMYFVDVKL